jgi:hypothetical protein
VFQFSGPAIGFAPEDRFMVALGNTLVVIRQDGLVFGADVVGRDIQPVFQFSGPAIGFAPEDRFMVAPGSIRDAHINVHIKVLSEPVTISRTQMIQSMQSVYAGVGIDLVISSVETLDLPLLNDLDVGACTMGVTTAEQNQLFANRNNAGPDDLCVYFVRSTVPPLNGCAAFPAGRPGAVVTSVASPWTMAHECGHVLGLAHVADTHRLMMGGGTWNITNPPPVLIQSEVETMIGSPFTV